MKPHFRTALVLASFALAGNALAQRQPSFPTGVGLVRIDAVVSDAQGRPVHGLTAADFELLENGRPQRIESFEGVVVRGTAAPPIQDGVRPPRARPADGALFVVFYDDLHLTPRHTAPARDAIRRFLDEGTRAGDRVTLVAPQQGLWWSARLPDEQGDLYALVDRLQGRRLRGDGGLDYQAMLVHHRGEDGLLENQLPGAIADRTAAAARADQQQNELAAQLAAGNAASIPAPPSRLAGGHADMRGMADPMRMAELADHYSDALRLNRLALEALRDSVAALAHVPGRKSLVLVSEGLVEDPDLRQLAQLVEAARVANAVVYFLDVRGVEVTSGYQASEPGSPALASGRAMGDALRLQLLVREGAALGSERIAEETGGRTLRGDLAAGLLRVAAEAHSYYLLGYMPADAGGSGFRKISVRVKKPGLTARARPGWRPLESLAVIEKRAPTVAVSPGVQPGATVVKMTGASPEANAVAAGRKADPLGVTREALDLLARSGAELTDVPLALSTYAFDEASPGKARVIVAADLDLPPAKGGATEIAYHLLVVPLGAPEGLEHSGRQALAGWPDVPWKGGFGTHEAFARAVELGPGRYQARLAVEIAGSGRRGAATRSFEVPPLGTLRLSTPIVTNRIQENGDRAPLPLIRGLKAFWSNTALFCQYEVFGARKGERLQVEAGYTLKAENGTVLRSAPPTRVQPMEDGRVLRLFGFPLEGVPAGRYTLTVEATDKETGATASASERFTVLAARR